QLASPVQCPPPSSLSPLCLHDALPIYAIVFVSGERGSRGTPAAPAEFFSRTKDRSAASRARAMLSGLSVAVFSRFSSAYGCSKRDRKSTRLNSSHQIISYAVFCLKKKT